MNRTIEISAAAIVFFVAATASSQTLSKQRAVGIESSTALTSLPSAVPSQWVIQTCPECPYVTLEVDENTAFFVGDVPVSIVTLQRYAARQTSLLSYFYEPQSLHLTQVVLHASIDAADAAKPPKSTR